MNIRQLIPSDNYLAVSKIFQKSWQEAYRNSVPQKFLDELPADLWVERLKKPGRKTLVAIQENIYIGLVGYGLPAQSLLNLLIGEKLWRFTFCQNIKDLVTGKSF